MRRTLENRLITIAHGVVLLVAFAGFGHFSAPAVAAVSASPAYRVSSKVSGSPNQTLTYEITLTRTGTFSHLVLALPAYAGTSGLQIGAGNLRGGRLERITGGFIYRAGAPYGIAAGTRLWVMVNGITVPPAGTYSVKITAYATDGTVLAGGTTPGLQFLAAKPCPASWGNSRAGHRASPGSCAQPRPGVPAGR